MPYSNRGPKRDHDFDNHPYSGSICNPLYNPPLGSLDYSSNRVAALGVGLSHPGSERWTPAIMGSPRVEGLGLRVSLRDLEPQ